MPLYSRELALRLRERSAGVADSGERPEHLLFVAAASQPVMHPCSNYACLLLEMHACIITTSSHPLFLDLVIFSSPCADVCQVSSYKKARFFSKT
jgi:hypothetical protein